ncbi:MAG: PKD repeat protein, partial [Arenicella sp.]
SNFAIFSIQKLENKQFYFDASEAFIDNSFQIKKYYWNFGDGNFECREMNPLVHHQYEKAGNYEIRMIIEGQNGEGKKKWICGMQKVRVY